MRRQLQAIVQHARKMDSQRLYKYARLWAMRCWRRLLVALWHRHTDSAPPPISAVLRLTNTCNLRCKQCGQWGDRGAFRVIQPVAIHEELSTGQWTSILSRLTAFCPHIYVFGGEPFARKDLFALVRVAVQGGATVGVNTNGTLLGSRSAEIIESGLDYIMVSLDGPQDVNDRIRIGSRGFTTVTDGIRELVAQKISVHSLFPRLELVMTLTVENQDRIIETAGIAKTLGVDVFAVVFGIFTTPELASASEREAREEFGRNPRFYSSFVRDMSGMNPDRIEMQISRVRKEWGARFKQYPPIQFRTREYFEHPERALASGKCSTPWLTMQIMANGDMAFCSDFPDFVVGNVEQTSLLALWNGEGSRAWRNRIRTKGVFAAENRCCDRYL